MNHIKDCISCSWLAFHFRCSGEEVVHQNGNFKNLASGGFKQCY